MNRIILQMDERGRVTIPQSLRKAWRLRPGDYLVIDPERKRIGRAEILTDEELADPANPLSSLRKCVNERPPINRRAL